MRKSIKKKWQMMGIQIISYYVVLQIYIYIYQIMFLTKKIYIKLCSVYNFICNYWDAGYFFYNYSYYCFPIGDCPFMKLKLTYKIKIINTCCLWTIFFFLGNLLLWTINYTFCTLFLFSNHRKCIIL